MESSPLVIHSVAVRQVAFDPGPDELWLRLRYISSLDLNEEVVSLILVRKGDPNSYTSTLENSISLNAYAVSFEVCLRIFF